MCRGIITIYLILIQFTNILTTLKTQKKQSGIWVRSDVLTGPATLVMQHHYFEQVHYRFVERLHSLILITNFIW